MRHHPRVEIDADACVACGQCVAVCPTRYLFQSAPKTTPAPVAIGNCISCGHCVSVCPKDAVSHSDMPPDALRPVQRNLAAHPVEELLRSKRSVRFYLDKPVPNEVLEQLFDIAAQAPTNSNTQDRELLVMTDRDRITAFEQFVIEGFRGWVEQALAASADPQSYPVLVARRFIEAYNTGIRPVFRNAPCVVCAHAQRDNFFGAYNCITAMDYMMLQGHAMGLGSCVIGAALHQPPDQLTRFLGLTGDRQLHAVTTFGYPRNVYRRTVARRPVPVAWNSGHAMQENTKGE